MNNAHRWFVGVDLGSQTHRVVVIDSQGGREPARDVKHSGEAQRELVEWLEKLSGGRRDQVAEGLRHRGERSWKGWWNGDSPSSRSTEGIKHFV